MTEMSCVHNREKRPSAIREPNRYTNGWPCVTYRTTERIKYAAEGKVRRMARLTCAPRFLALHHLSSKQSLGVCPCSSNTAFEALRNPISGAYRDVTIRDLPCCFFADTWVCDIFLRRIGTLRSVVYRMY